MKFSGSFGIAHAQRREVAVTSFVPKRAVDLLVDQDALHADAALPRLVEGAEDDALDRVALIGVGLHHHRRIAAQLEHHGLLADPRAPSGPSPPPASR